MKASLHIDGTTRKNTQLENAETQVIKHNRKKILPFVTVLDQGGDMIFYCMTCNVLYKLLMLLSCVIVVHER